jgi:putative addiction module component (TIGR02574 family)
MTTTASRLLEQVLLLPEDEREELVGNILDQSLPPSDFVAEQMITVRRRIEDVKEGRSALIPAEEAHQRVREAIIST